ncbi:MAG: hypothetical protein MK180_05915 [Rhodobacteraceae bacterium]|nr:hypothetical protein [Paracoccaceae bacterium]
MPYIIAAVLLAAFIANVSIGALGQAAPAGIVAEALVLFGAAIAFSVGILRSEASAKAEADNSKE